MLVRSVLCCFIYASNILAKDVKIITERRRLSDVDPLLDAVRHEQWDEDEVPCVDATLAVLQGVKNSTLWATWIWDSMQRPVGFLYGSRYQLGSFDQCMKPPWLDSHPHLRTQYCLADIHLTETTPKRQTDSLDPYSRTGVYFDITSKHGRYLNVLTWGVCLPNVCSQRSVRKLVRSMFRTQHLPPSSPDPYITVDSCQIAGDRVEYTPELYYFLLLLLGLTMMSILATFISTYATTNSLGCRLVKSFDLRNNWINLIEDKKGDVKSLNGMKFFTTIVVVAMHYLLYVNKTAIINALDGEKDWDTALGTSLLGIDVFLETFYFISGLLLMKGLMSGKKKSPLVGLIKRYIRMLYPLAVIVFYIAAVHKYTGSGPLWPRFSSEEQQLCIKNWWLNLLMLSNYVRDTEICYIITWYIASDFQLAVIGSALFYIYQKYRRIGKWLFLITVVITALIPALVTYWYEVPVGLFHDIQELLDLRDNKMLLTVHVKTHCRAVVYLLGMLMGYCMSFYKTENYRNVISKKLSIVGAAIAFYIMLKVIRDGGLLVHMEYDLMEVSIFAAFRKILWVIAISCLIVVCEYGYVPIVTDILWAKPWGALSRLCYVMYLVHMAVVYRHAHSTRSPVTYEYFELIFNGIGVLFSMLPICLYLYMFVEAPAGNIVNCLFESKQIQSCDAVSGNGVEAAVKSKTK